MWRARERFLTAKPNRARNSGQVKKEGPTLCEKQNRKGKAAPEGSFEKVIHPPGYSELRADAVI
jgi:hypothetical protein